MTKRSIITEAEIAREFRLHHVRGSPADAVTNTALRICLTNCAEVRKKRQQTDQPTLDGKRLAAGDID